MRITLIVVAACLALGPLGCGNGGETPTPTYDLSGWWEYAVRESGAATPYVIVAQAPASHTGTTVLLNNSVRAGITLMQDGTSLSGAHPNATDDPREEYDLRIVTNDRMEGTSTAVLGGGPVATLDLRLIRISPPTGSFTINGTVSGEPASYSSSTPYAIARITPPETYTLNLLDLEPDRTVALGITFDHIPLGATGSYAVGPAAGEIAVAFSVRGAAVPATAGTVAFTRIDETRVAGTFTLTLGGLGTLTGTFDMAVLVTIDTR